MYSSKFRNSKIKNKVKVYFSPFNFQKVTILAPYKQKLQFWPPKN